MRRVLALLLCSLPCFGAVAFDAISASGFGGSGVNSTSFTASGTNIVCSVYIIYRSGTYNSNPTCGGQAMTKIATGAISICLSATADLWIVASGITAGTISASVNMTVESQIVAITVNGGKQSGQPDSVPSFTSGNFTGVAGGQEAALPFTTRREQFDSDWHVLHHYDSQHVAVKHGDFSRH